MIKAPKNTNSMIEFIDEFDDFEAIPLRTKYGRSDWVEYEEEEDFEEGDSRVDFDECEFLFFIEEHNDMEFEDFYLCYEDSAMVENDDSYIVYSVQEKGTEEKFYFQFEGYYTSYEGFSYQSIKLVDLHYQVKKSWKKGVQEELLHERLKIIYKKQQENV